MTEPTTPSATAAQSTRSPLLLVVFWGYVLIPLVWGVLDTGVKAMALFR